MWAVLWGYIDLVEWVICLEEYTPPLNIFNVAVTAAAVAVIFCHFNGL